MLTLNTISRRFADRLLFDNLTLTINRGDCLGLIGPNGTGKSTVLGIMAGILVPDTGTRTLAPYQRIGYLPQGTLDLASGTLRHALDAPSDGFFSLLDSLNAATGALAGSYGDEEPVLLRWEAAQRQFDAVGGYAMLDRVEALLDQFHLPAQALDRPLDDLSGGERTRAGLAVLLAMQPDVLLLDEPTNHLDLAARRWLIDFVNDYPGAIVVVSHDRAFLQETVNRILAFEQEGDRCALCLHNGDYADYIETRQQRRTAEAKTYKRQQEQIRGLQTSIDQGERSARKIEGETTHFHYRMRAQKIARAASVRRARLERMLESETLADKPHQTWGLALDFPEPAARARDVMQLDQVRIVRDDRVILAGISLTLRYGERVALIGANGAGKTTLMHVVSGELAPDAGYRKPAPGLRIGTLAQDQDTLAPDRTVLDTVREHFHAPDAELRTELHKYLFGGESVHRRIRDLSWGERTRLMLASIAIPGADLLLLDEPLNHLDVQAREEFEEALTAFPGTVLLIAHDRYAINRIATRILRVRNGSIEEVGPATDPEFASVR